LCSLIKTYKETQRMPHRLVTAGTAPDHDLPASLTSNKTRLLNSVA
jgi:hypothetical protein